jgi:hypothetical protein
VCGSSSPVDEAGLYPQARNRDRDAWLLSMGHAIQILNRRLVAFVKMSFRCLILDLLYLTAAGSALLLFLGESKIWYYLAGSLACLASAPLYVLLYKGSQMMAVRLLVQRFLVSSIIATWVSFFILTHGKVDLFLTFLLAYVAAQPFRQMALAGLIPQVH